MENQFELKRLMVCLDLSKMDEPLIKFTSYIAQKMNSERIYFIHITPTLDVQEEVKKNYPGLFTPVDEALKKEMEASVSNNFVPPPHCTVEVEVREGNPSDKIIQIAGQKDIDLLLLGKKETLEGKGVLPGRLAKIVHRSVLIVPERLPKQIDRLLVPVDFSNHSLLALQQAINIKEKSEAPMQISCLHIYKLPTGWYSTGKTETEFSEIMKGHAQKDYDKFIKNLPPQYHKIPCIFILGNNTKTSQMIYQEAIKDQSNLIIMGSKGKTLAATVLMGSTTEKLTDLNSNIPLLVVKEKDENMNFLQALLHI